MKIISPFENTLRKEMRPSKKSKSSKVDFSRFIETPQTDEHFLEELFSDPHKTLENIFLLSEKIENAGQELADRPTPENFLNYKKYVSLAVKSAVRNLEVDQRVARRLNRETIYKTAQEIDTEIATLARKILDGEKNRLDILQLTGHLKGLVLSLFA